MRRLKSLFVFSLFVVGCHATCGDNYAETYGRALDHSAKCQSLWMSTMGTLGTYPDFASCLLTSGEIWICSGVSVETSNCYVSSATPVRYVRGPTPAER
jgi:hypothetical protein